MLFHVTIFYRRCGAVRARSVRREGESFVFASTYMALKEPAPPEILKELIAFSDKDKIPSMTGTDATLTIQHGVTPTLTQERWNYSQYSRTA